MYGLLQLFIGVTFTRQLSCPQAVLTRRDQLEAKKKAKKPDQDDGNEDGTQEAQKKPAARSKANAKEKAQPKAKAKVQPKPQASPKKRSRGAKRLEPKEEEKPAVGPKPKKAKMEEAPKTPPTDCQLFPDEDPEEEEKEVDPPVEEEPVVLKRPAAKKAKKACKEEEKVPEPDALEPEAPEAEVEEKPKKKARAKAKAKAKAKQSPKKKREAKSKAGSKRKSTKINAEELGEDGEADELLDDTMEGIVLTMIKEVKSCTFDTLKEVLLEKKENLHLVNKHARLNIYWTKCSGAVSMPVASDPKVRFDACAFAFKRGSWNSRMAAAFACSFMAATCLQLWPTFI